MFLLWIIDFIGVSPYYIWFTNSYILKGYVSAQTDGVYPTVVELIPIEFSHRDIFLCVWPDKYLIEEMVIAFRDGVLLNDGECKSSELKIIDKRSCYVTLTEGRYHQIKEINFKYWKNL